MADKTYVVHTNFWRDGSIIAVSSETAQFAPEYTQDDSLQLYWRSTDADSSGEAIDCDFGEAKEYDFVGILGHNISASATIKIYGADDDAFSVNVVEDSLTYYGNSLWQKLSASRTKRYCRISIVDPLNASGYIQIATIVVGKVESLNRKPTIPYERGTQNDTAIDKSPSETIFTVQTRPSVGVRQIPFEGLSDASASVIESLLENCGSHVAWALCLNVSSLNGNTYWVRLQRQSLPVCNSPNNWDWNGMAEEIV